VVFGLHGRRHDPAERTEGEGGPGQALARLEGRVALEELLARFPEWEVDWSTAQYDTATPDLRGWKVLPLVVS